GVELAQPGHDGVLVGHVRRDDLSEGGRPLEGPAGHQAADDRLDEDRPVDRAIDRADDEEEQGVGGADRHEDPVDAHPRGEGPEPRLVGRREGDAAQPPGPLTHGFAPVLGAVSLRTNPNWVAKLVRAAVETSAEMTVMATPILK